MIVRREEGEKSFAPTAYAYIVLQRGPKGKAVGSVTQKNLLCGQRPGHYPIR